MTTQNSHNKFRDTASDEGFFKECFKNLKNVTTENQLKDFELIKTDEERVRFVQKLFPDNFKFPIEVSETKNFETAKDFKLKGNKVFVKNDNRAALDFYTKAILATPYTEEYLSELAITLANRSAALYHLQDYESALNDINWAFDLPYPKELKYKAQERKARCLLALNKHNEALLEFRNTLQALDDSKLPTEKRLKMQTDIQIMLGVMTKPKTKSGHINAFLESSKNKNIKKEEFKHKLCSSRNKIYEAGCDKFEILESNELGRYASATDDIKAGDTILIEKAFCTAMLRECSTTHCTNCFKRAYAPYPCKTCSNVIFCSAQCRDKSESSYHKYECKILNSIYKSGASVMVLMALRMVTERSLNFFLEIKNKLQEKPEFKKYKTTDYLTVYNLVRHEDQRQTNDFFERTTMALFLLQCLKKSNYFQNTLQDHNQISDEEYFITSLILRHLQLLQFNAHEIFELEVASNKRIDDSQTVFIGGALFPTLALFNHSCNPDTIRYFDGTTVIMRTMKPVCSGEMISENYGPLFTLTNKKERQDTLKSQFWFDCTCTACEENWPTFHEMNKKLLRFRCDARRDDGGKYNTCKNVIAVPVDTEEFLVPCLLCNQHTNIFKGLKALQDTDAMFKQASRDMEKGNYQVALAIYIEIITILDSVMKPPFQDFTLCQQAIRKCMLTFGNKYIKNSCMSVSK